MLRTNPGRVNRNTYTSVFSNGVIVGVALLGLGRDAVAQESDHSELHVRIIVDELICDSTTERGASNRDEIYFEVADPSDQARHVRVPGPWNGEEEPIFEFGNRDHARGVGWLRRKDQLMPEPTLWEGTLKMGDRKTLAFTVREQDNADAKKISDALNFFVQVLGLPQIPNFGKEHDYLGGFTVSFENHPDHGLSIMWGNQKNAKWSNSPNTPSALSNDEGALLTSTNGGKYRVAFTALSTAIPREQPRTPDTFHDWIPPGKSLDRLYIRHDRNGIHGFCSEWIGKEGQHRQRGQFYGNHKAGELSVVELSNGEHLQEVVVYRQATGIVQGISFVTDKDRKYPPSGCYGTNKGDKRVMRPAAGRTIVGFKGRRGFDIDDIYVVER